MNREDNLLIKFYEKIGIVDGSIQQGMSIFWLVSVSVVALSVVGSLCVKFILWLF